MIKVRNIFLFLLLINISVFAQEEEPDPRDYDCAKNHTYSFSDRLNHYPFNASKKVVVVSFDAASEDSVYVASPDSLDEEKHIRIPIKNNQLDTEKIKENFILTTKQLEGLTEILYNYDYRNDKGVRSATQCFEPHHGLVFLDEQNKIVAYVEICFICSNFEVSNEKIEIGNFCFGKFKLLKQLFKDVGVKVMIE